MKSSSQYQVEIVRDIKGLISLREDWRRVSLVSEPPPNPQAVLDPVVDMDFYLAEVQSWEGWLKPHVIVLRQDRAVQTILVGRLQKRTLQESIGYKRFSSCPVRILTIIHAGMLGRDSEDGASVLLDSIKETLREREADCVWFYGMTANSPFYRVARSAASWLTRDYYPSLLGRWRLRLPGCYEELYRKLSSNTRHNLKRYSERLRDAFPNQLTVKSFRDPNEVETLFSDTEVIAAKTYQRGLGVGFIDNAFMRQRAKLAATRGCLRAYILYVADKPAAYWNGVLHHRTFFTWTTGYDPDLGNLRPGTFLLQNMLQELCSEKSADLVDFGFGDAQYKRDWCDHEHFQESLYIFAPTLTGLSLNVFHSSVNGAANAARGLLARIGVEAKLKKAWRDRLARAKR